MVYAAVEATSHLQVIFKTVAGEKIYCPRATPMEMEILAQSSLYSKSS